MSLKNTNNTKSKLKELEQELKKKSLELS